MRTEDAADMTGKALSQMPALHLEEVLMRAESALVFFKREQIESLLATCELLATQVQPLHLTSQEVTLLATRCRSLQYLLRYTSSNLAVLGNLASAQRGYTPFHHSHRGYPWQH